MGDTGRKTLYVVTTMNMYVDLIRESLPNVEVVCLLATGYKQDVTVQAFEKNESLLKDVEILFTTPYILAKYADKLVNLKWIHSPANGADALMKNTACLKPHPSFIFTKTHGSVNAPNTTEYVIGHIIARERHFLSIREAQENKDWNMLRQSNSYRNLSNITIGVMGLGGIGSYLAERCKRLGMTVWALTRHLRSLEERQSFVDEYRITSELGEFLKNCDYICNVLPSTPETRHLLAGDVLQNCASKGAVLINVGRGDIIDEDSIVKAIQNKWISGAILDVFEKEPLPADSCLWTLPGVTITPHVSGWSHTVHRQCVVRNFAENFERYVRNEPLQNVFNWDKGY